MEIMRGVPMAVEGEEEQSVNGLVRNSVHTLLPSQTISLSSSAASASTSTSAAATTSANPLGCIISEAKRFSEEIKKLNERLALAEQRNEELTEENSTQNTRLVEAAELIAEQQRQLDGRFAFSFGQEAEENGGGGGGGEANMADLRELKTLVAQERKQRLDAEEKFAKLKNSLKNMNAEYSQFFEEVKEHLIEQDEESTAKERLDRFSKFMQDRFQKHVEEQLALKTTVKGLNKAVENLLKVIEAQKLKPATSAATKLFAKNIARPPTTKLFAKNVAGPSPKTKVGVKIVPRQPIKVAKTEQVTVPPETTQAVVEHAEDTSKSIQGFFCICGSEYSSKSNLVIHIRTYTVDGKFKCQLCHEKFVLFYMLRRHLRSKHNIEPKKGSGAHTVGCMECGKTFSSSANLWKHRKSEHSKASIADQYSTPASTPIKRPASPPPSEDSNDSVEFLEEHFDDIPNHPNWKNPSTSPARFITPKIMKVSSEPVSISGKKHGMNIAKRHQGFFCICGIKFISRKSLDGHVQFQNKNHAESSTSSSSLQAVKFGSEHHGVHPSKPLQCICGFRSASKYNTSKHVMYYTTERKFQCELCPKRLLNMGYLREHYARSHKLSRNTALGHGCRKCGISFESMREFHDHSRIVHGFGNPNGSVKQESSTPRASTSASASLSTSPVTTKFRRTSLPVTRPGKGPTITGVRGSLGGVTTPKKLSSAVDSSVEKKFGCVICSGAFTRIYDLHRHLRNIHEADPTNFPIGCPDCDSTFRTRQNFIRHRVSVHNSTIERKRQLKTETKINTDAPSASSSGSSVPIPIFNLDDDYDDEEFYESPPLSPEPIPIAYEFENEKDIDDDDEMSVMPKLEPTHPAVPYAAAAVGVEYGEEEDEEQHDEEDDDEEQSPTDTLVDVHEQDLTKSGEDFYCTCGVKFVSQKNFRTHIKQKTQQWNFECKICQKKFFYNSYLKAHMLKTHKIVVADSEDANIGCVYCGSTFETFFDLRQHQKAEHNDKAQNSGTSMQQLTPTSSPSRRSRQSPKLTTNAAATTIGNARHGYDTEKQRLGLFYCICGKNCGNKKSLQGHITYNKRDRNFPCHICGSRFPFQSFLSQHLERSHKMKRTNLREIRSTKRIKRKSRCTKCGKNFKTQMLLLRHKKSFHKTVVADLTPAADLSPAADLTLAARSRSSNKKVINRNSPHHQVSSSSSDEYTCACGYKYAQKSSLVKHIAKQARGRIFKCPQCSKAFMEASSLRLHAETVHNVDLEGKHHGCGICGELFESMTERIRHRIQVHQVRR